MGDGGPSRIDLIADLLLEALADPAPIVPRYLNQADAASYLRYRGVKTTFKESVLPELEALGVVMREGRTVRFDVDDLEAWVRRYQAAQAVAGPPCPPSPPTPAAPARDARAKGTTGRKRRPPSKRR